MHVLSRNGPTPMRRPCGPLFTGGGLAVSGRRRGVATIAISAVWPQPCASRWTQTQDVSRCVSPRVAAISYGGLRPTQFSDFRIC
jgi:hypothetical protein